MYMVVDGNHHLKRKGCLFSVCSDCFSSFSEDSGRLPMPIFLLLVPIDHA
jgi:hypothetical protein